MSEIRTIPDIRTLVEPLIGTPYASYDCWDLVRHLYQQGFGFGLVRDTQVSAQHFQEVWFRGDAADLVTIVQPWDLVITIPHDDLPVSNGVGVAVDHQMFVHASQRETGVVLGRLRTWKPRILQLARFRELM